MKRRSTIYVLLLTAGSFYFMTLLMAGISTKSIVASRAESPLKIDGYLTDEAWRAAVPVEAFRQFNPEEGAPATERTAVSVLYDDHALYIGVHCYDGDPAEIRTLISRRDRSVQADKFTVLIDSYHDHQTAFLFSGTVSGVQSDGILSQDGLVYTGEWDAVWDFSAQIVEDGWTAEFRLPFSALRFAEQPGEYVWGINFRRDIPRKQEADQWVMVPRKDVNPGTILSVSQIGHLTGLQDIHPPLHLEILPYAVTKQTLPAQSDPLALKNKLEATAGVDVKYGITNNLTFDVAINPDFGQVEVDQAVLNLTVFETFYPEKRPFFLEGSQLLSFGNVFDSRELLLFYSRRIGSRPSAVPDSDFQFTETPQTARILGAGKLTGKTDDGLAVGFMTAVTDREEGVEENLSGVRRNVLFENRASYNTIRLRQDVFNNSYVGVMATGAFHEMASPVLSGGLDWNLRFVEGMYALDGYVAGSEVSTAPGQRLSGTAGRIGVGKLQGDHWLTFSLYEYSSKNFNLDDLGYYSQPREHGGYTQITYKEDHAVEPLLRFSLNAELDYTWNWDQINTGFQFQFIPIFDFRNFWSLSINYTHRFSSYDDLSRGVVGLYHRPAGEAVTATLQTDLREPLVVALSQGYRTTATGQRTVSTSLAATIRASTWIEFVPGAQVVHTRKEENWFIPFYPIFGDRDIDEYNFSLRGTVTFNRNMSVQLFTQVFLAKAQYDNFRLLADPDDLRPTSSYGGNPDFNDRVVNANVVFRWEYQPGSTLYLVWTQLRSGSDAGYDRGFGESFSDAFRLPMDNVLLAKVSYWWSL